MLNPSPLPDPSTQPVVQLIWTASADGALSFLNDEWLGYTGQTAHPASLEALFSPWLHEDDLAATSLAWQEASTRAAGFAVEHRIRNAGGQYRWFMTQAKPRTAAHGQPVHQWLGSSIEIHAQKEASAEAQRRVRLYETFLSTTPDLSYVWDLDHRFTYANRVLLEMWGMSWDEAIGKNCLEIGYEPWHADMHSREIEQVRATKRPFRGDVPFNGTFGRRIYDYILFPVLGPDGEVEAVAGTTRDVTERKHSEARQHALFILAEEIRAVRALPEVALAAARVIGEALSVKWVSFKFIDKADGQVRERGDWTFETLAQAQACISLHDERSAHVWPGDDAAILVADVAADARTEAWVSRYQACGAASFLDVCASEDDCVVAAVQVTASVPRAWSEHDVLLVRDVSRQANVAAERIRGELALAQSEARLREINESLEAEVSARTKELMAIEEALRHSQKIEAIGQLTGGLAHDFNNLLGGITGGLDLMRLRLSQGRTEDLERYIDLSLRSVNRAASLTQRLLAFARRQTLDPKPTNVNSLVGGMEELIRRTIGPAVELEVVGAGGLWSTFVDAPQLESALLNLCINARDAMPDGGRLTIETANKWLDEQWAHERDLPSGQYISICVTDTGTGMTPEVIVRAFDPFFTTKPIGEGTGLGLSMVYGFARQSGGQIRIYSELGQGTTMCIYLPRHHQDAAEREEIAFDSPGAMGGSGEVILVVDDEASIRMLVAEVLIDAGYAVLEAKDGPSALRILQSTARIDLLITDVGLPGGLNGRQVADAARQARSGLKVLFITGYAENAVIGNGHLEPGMQILAKPFKMDTLSSRVRAIMEGVHGVWRGGS